jgi:hypothetical protein
MKCEWTFNGLNVICNGTQYNRVDTLSPSHPMFWAYLFLSLLLMCGSGELNGYFEMERANSSNFLSQAESEKKKRWL